VALADVFDLFRVGAFSGGLPIAGDEKEGFQPL
jgi:hypothetical protein